MQDEGRRASATQDLGVLTVPCGRCRRRLALHGVYVKISSQADSLGLREEHTVTGLEELRSFPKSALLSLTT